MKVDMKNTEYYKSGAHAANALKAQVKARQSTANNKKARINAYNLSPILCKHCKSPIAYDKRTNKFCSKSCGAHFNNANRPKESRNKQKQTIADYYKSLKPYDSTTKIYTNVYSDSFSYVLIITPDMIYPSYRKGVIKTAQVILNKREITYGDIDTLTEIIKHHIIVDEMPISAINDKYDLGFKDFYCVVATLDIDVIDLKPRKVTDEKLVYKNNCQFKFDIFSEPKIIGYDLLSKYKFSGGFSEIHKDHMYSMNDGFANNIPPAVISHPANCAILLAVDNIKKGPKSSITIDELYERIKNW